ncbi:MAG: hypothetical protein K6L80_11205 [Agarilytica sp.]
MVRLFIVVIIVISLLLFMGLNIDDDIDPKVSAFVSSQDGQPDENEGYFYLMGISAPADKDPEVVGRQYYEKVSDITQIELFHSYADIKREELPLSESDLFCNFLTPGCFEKVFHATEDLRAIIDDYALLQKRWQHYVSIDDFKTITSPTIFEQFPPYKYITRVNRVLIMSSISDWRESRPAVALEKMENNIRHLRRQLVLQDNLIGKLTIAQLIAEHLDVLFLLVRKNEGLQPPKMTSLTNDEKSLKKAIVREFAMAIETFRAVGNHPELWREEKSLPSWMGKYIFKPNMSINAVFPIYRRAAEYAELAPIAFTKAMLTGPDIELKSSLIRNFFGTELIQVARVDLLKYIGEFNDLNAKIILFNTLINREITEDIVQSVYSPYYATNRTAAYSENGERICVSGPLQDDKNIRCVKIKIRAAEPN